MDNKFKILFTGDTFIKTDSDSILSDALKDIVKSHQLSVCAFEGSLETPDAKPIKKAGPHLKQSAKASETLINDGFNIINLANNHICDYGDKALQNTLDSFKNVITLGAGIDFESAYKPKFTIVNDTKVGLFSFCEAEFGVITDNSRTKAGYAWINHHDVNEMIRNAKRQCDILIVLVHAGVEFIDYPLPEWRQRFYELINKGADAIICCHTHQPQGWEMYNDKPIFYSLGNFFFDMPYKHPFWDTGYCVSLNISNKKIVDFNLIPTEKKGNIVDINKDVAFSSHLDNLCLLLQSPDYTENINNICIDLWNKRYKKYFVDALGWNYYRFSWKDIIAIIYNTFRNKPFYINHNIDFNRIMLIANIKIESHRWAIIRALTHLEDKEK